MTTCLNQTNKENYHKTVSVIIPCYNDGEFLEETVVSTLHSTYSPIELILINDGSTDDTREIGLRLQDQFENVRYFEQENKGPSAARNHGVQESNGDFILPLDADDKIHSSYIEQASRYLSNNEHIKIVYSKAEFFGNKKGRWKLSKYNLKKIARQNMIFNCAMYRKSDFLESGGYSEELNFGWEDWEFWISMLKLGGIAFQIPEVYFFYRIKDAENSLIKSMNNEKERKVIDFINSKHSDFILEQLNGPLRYNRKWSRTINIVSRIFGYIS